MQNRQMDTRGPGAADKNSSNIKTRSVMARELSQECAERKMSSGPIQKPKLDCINFIDPEDMEVQGKTRVTTSGTASGMQPCHARFKTLGTEKRYGENKPNTRKSKRACIVEAHESTTKHLERTVTILRNAKLRSRISLGHRQKKTNALARCRSGQRAWRNKKPVLSFSAVTHEDCRPLENEDESGRRLCVYCENHFFKHVSKA